MAGKPKRKASDLTEEDRADAIALLFMQGWKADGTGIKGALTSTANHLNLWPMTLRRWATGESNPPANSLVTKKKQTLVGAIEDEMWAIIGQMDFSREMATYQQLGTVFGIMFDKMQLLTGGPTENINQRVMVLNFGDAPNGNGRTVSN